MSSSYFKNALAVLYLSLIIFYSPILSANTPSSVVIVSDDTLLVKFVPGTRGEIRRNAHAEVRGNIKKSIVALGVDVINVPKGTTQSAITSYMKNPNVVYAEANITRPIIYPNTTEGSEPTLGITNNFNEQYGLHNEGQAFGAVADALGNIIAPAYQASSGADINAPEAWAIMEPNDPIEPIGVAVLDSGVDCYHLDLLGKCIEGINYVADQSAGDDIIGHGTHVAGIIAATMNNQIGIAGVAPNALIGSMKVCWESVILGTIIAAGCDDDDIADALAYVADSGMYRVINMSLAGTQGTETLRNAVDYAWNKGLVIVAAAGNAYSTQRQYPAAYDNVIAVGATDYHDNLAAYSTFDNSWVSVLAPGTAIMSTMPGPACGQDPNESSDCYDWKSGTSMASPHVAGVAAVLAAHPNLYSNTDIRNIIEDSSDDMGTHGQDFGAWAQHGRINMAASLGHQQDPEPPAPNQATIHSVDSIVAAVINVGRGNKKAQVTVTIIDDLGASVEGVEVTVNFTGSITESGVKGSTDANGVTVITSTAQSKGGVTFEACVTLVADTSSTQWDGDPICATGE